MKLQISNYKSQFPNERNIPFCLEFKNWKLGFVCDLVFGISLVLVGASSFMAR